MKKLCLCIAVCTLAWSSIFAQKEGNVWHFGVGAAMDFSSGTPQAVSPSSMWTVEGSAAISDVNGNLLFYTNGGGRDPITSGQSSGKIWNKQHNVMYDMGFTEGGGFSSAQSSVIVPRPGVTGNYYLFTMEEVEFPVGGDVPGQPFGRGLSYFEIDMALNAGLGGVVNYEGLAYVPTYEGLCSVRHANGSDYWIIVHRGDNLGLAVFPVTGLGVGTPVLFDAGTTTGGVIKASPDGKWLSCLSDSGFQSLSKFDNTNGTVSDLMFLDAFPNYVEFSPNSKRLFFTSDNQVQYFDLTAPDINTSKTIVDDFPGFDFANGFNYLIGQMQLGPDGKIYMLRSDFQTDSVLISAIACPNSSPYLEINTLGFYPGPDQLVLGLPNFDNGIFRRETDNFDVNLGPDLVTCNGEMISLDPGTSGGTYTWSTGSTTQSISVNTPGTYFVQVTTGCGVSTDSIVVSANNTNASAGKDTVICQGAALQMNGQGNGGFTWNPVSAVSNPNISNPFYTGQVSTDLILTVEKDGCSNRDTVSVIVLPSDMITVSPADTAILPGTAVQLTGVLTGVWGPAAGLSCTNCTAPVATPDTTTTYFHVFVNMEGCADTAEVTITVLPPECRVQIPNAFTPNGDDVNGNFKPIGDLDRYALSVFSRWGKKVYEGTSPWDGRFEGKDAPVDVYFYKANVTVCGADKLFTGEVSLLR